LAADEEVLVLSGAEEGIFICMNVLLQKEDHIIVHFPCYQSLIEVAQGMVGCSITKWETSSETSWDLDLDVFEKSIRPNTKMVIVNSPHNPTGYLMSRDKQRKLVDICKKHNLLLFFDEVYRLLEYQENTRLPAACDLYDNAISLGVLSKSFGLPGLRIGWIATKNKDVIQKVASFKDYTTICSSAPSEFLAIESLKAKEKLLSRNLSIVTHNLLILDSFFEKNKRYFSWIRPQAGTIAFPKLEIAVHVEDFAEDLRKRKGVLLLPGNCYSYGDKHFRLGFGRKNMPEAVQKLQEYLDEGYLDKLPKRES